MNRFVLLVAVLCMVYVHDSYSESDGGESNPSPAKIVGGQYARLGAFPFTLLLEKKSVTYKCIRVWWGTRCTKITKWSHFCGAALINARWAVSAKHCFKNTHYSQARVRGGLKCKTERGVAALIAYVRYYGNTDFALLKLRSNVQGRYIRPISIPSGQISYSYCYVIGWGRIALGGPSSNCLKYSRVNIVQGYKCTRNYLWSLCARYKTSSACNGDSGGPLACWHGGKWNLVGLVWYGNGPICGLNSPNGYTRVSYFRNYINSQTG